MDFGTVRDQMTLGLIEKYIISPKPPPLPEKLLLFTYTCHDHLRSVKYCVFHFGSVSFAANNSCTKYQEVKELHIGGSWRKLEPWFRFMCGDLSAFKH